jgi:NAD(P)-dependent dehydrogenase (short-subunit alcohol dehydrogenase family)
MAFDFSGKSAVVTGGANGIGLAIAQVLAEGGAAVTILDLERERPAEVAAALGMRGAPADVTVRESLDAAFGAIERLDIVCANAGHAVQTPLLETSREVWDRTVAVNLSGVFNTLQAAALKMRAQGTGGAIVLTASTNSFDGEENLVAYNATKAGLLGILHTAANELGPYGIRVNAICPGLIRTRLTESYFGHPEVLKPYFQHIALGRGGMPREVAQAAGFLASHLASFVTGATLLVDGGQMASKFGTWNETNAEFAGDHWRLKR